MSVVTISIDLSCLNPEDKQPYLNTLKAVVEVSGVDVALQLHQEQVEVAAMLDAWDGNFLYVTDLRSLNRKIFLTFEFIHLRPTTGARLVEPLSYWELALSAEDHGANPYAPPACLISSVFHADNYLPAFLENCGELVGYEECQHFLVTCKSATDSLPLLIRHVDEHPGCLLACLAADPGLYEIWNTCIQLSAARYLSNANVDDRRHPSHLSKLIGLLDQNDGLDVACSQLVIVGPTEDSTSPETDKEILFGAVKSGVYGFADLFTSGHRGKRARNLPHCMPVWRRNLHTRFGWFDESNYGPSADWEFWMRVTQAGAKIGFVGVPLGCYRVRPDSYFRARSLEKQSQRILNTYCADQPLTRPPTLLLKRMAGSLSRGAELDALGMLIGLLRSGSSSRFIGRLIESTFETRLNQSVQSVSAACRIAITSETSWSPWRAALLQLFGHGALLATAPKQNQHVVWLLCELWQATLDNIWLICLAATVRFSRPEMEQAILRHLSITKPEEFWLDVRWAYPWAVSLRDVARQLGQEYLSEDALGGASGRSLAYFPAYKANDYQTLLYSRLAKSGTQVIGLSDLDALVALKEEPPPILHVHWLNAIADSHDRAEIKERFDLFLDTLEALKRQGTAILWTIHNRVSHDAAHSDLELELRRRLCNLASKVLVHHPVVPYLLDWLPETQKTEIAEHGSYVVSDRPDVNQRRILKANARQEFGFGPQDVVLTYFGQIRPYKGLASSLPAIVEAMTLFENLRLVIIGRSVCHRSEQIIQQARSPRLLRIAHHVNRRVLDRYLLASDFGLFSYRDILTSGALIHCLSAGLPAIAPAKGTIAAYLNDSWNGYLYDDSNQGIAEALARASNTPRGLRLAMANNARTLANSLRWTL